MTTAVKHAVTARNWVAHVSALDEMAVRECDGAILAAAAVMLAVSLGYAPGEVAVPRAIS